MADQERERRLLRQAVDWWEADRSRLVIIRSVAYGLFLASVVGTVYAGIKGALPIWAITLYVFFTVQLVFMTFMYAIKHSGQEEIRRAIFDVRRARQAEWQFERASLVEFARLTACQSAGLDPTIEELPSRRGRLMHARMPLPALASKEAEARRLVNAALASPGAGESTNHSREEGADGDNLELKFVAYSSETLIELSREMVAELEDVLESREDRFRGEVTVKILVRELALEHQWLIPLAKDERADIEYADDLRTRFRNVQRSALKEFEESLKELIPPKQVHFAVRGYGAEPLFKGLLVNETEGMIGFYTISPLKDPDGWDYSGHGMDFCRISTGGNPFERAAAKMFNEWFEEMWDERHSRSVSR